MTQEFDLEQWKHIHNIILGLIIPILFVICTLYFLLCLIYPIFIIFVAIVYLLCTGASRETFWISDFIMSRIIGYEDMMVFLWSHIKKPPTRITYLKMFYFWLLLVKPEFECRVRRLKRMHHAYENKRSKSFI